ncbi:MAG: hypothetical protein ABI637_05265 [Gemmatimonadota bacterium]
MRNLIHIDADGRRWDLRQRETSRRDEAVTHVTVEIESLGETRVAICRREEWESAELDLGAIVGQSVGAGASRHRGSGPTDST